LQALGIITAPVLVKFNPCFEGKLCKGQEQWCFWWQIFSVSWIKILKKTILSPIPCFLITTSQKMIKFSKISLKFFTAPYTMEACFIFWILPNLAKYSYNRSTPAT
jgi:hypothetical protein